MNTSNVSEVLSLLNDKQYLEVNNINTSDIIKAIKMAKEELKELEDIVDTDYHKGEDLEGLCDKLGGHNEYFKASYPDANYFDLNYKSLLVTIKQYINEDGIKGPINVSRNDVFIYPDNICKGSTYDEMLVIDFDETEGLQDCLKLLEERVAEETKKESCISDERKDKIIDELIDYVSEHTVDDEDFHNALKDIVGLSDEEINLLGIEINDEIYDEEEL